MFVASFIGAPPINLVEGEAKGDAVRVGDIHLPLEGTASGPVTAGFRPENLSLARGGIQGVVSDIEPMGREVLYMIETKLGRPRVLEGGFGAARGGPRHAGRRRWSSSSTARHSPAFPTSG